MKELGWFFFVIAVFAILALVIANMQATAVHLEKELCLRRGGEPINITEQVICFNKDVLKQNAYHHIFVAT